MNRVVGAEVEVCNLAHSRFKLKLDLTAVVGAILTVLRWLFFLCLHLPFLVVLGNGIVTDDEGYAT